MSQVLTTDIDLVRPAHLLADDEEEAESEEDEKDPLLDGEEEDAVEETETGEEA